MSQTFGIRAQLNVNLEIPNHVIFQNYYILFNQDALPDMPGKFCTQTSKTIGWEENNKKMRCFFNLGIIGFNWFEENFLVGLSQLSNRNLSILFKTSIIKEVQCKSLYCMGLIILIEEASVLWLILLARCFISEVNLTHIRSTA